MAKQSKKKKNVQINPVGEAHIQASFNNIIISLCNEKGQVISKKIHLMLHKSQLRNVVKKLLILD
jgi:ribosomal protein S11